MPVNDGDGFPTKVLVWSASDLSAAPTPGSSFMVTCARVLMSFSDDEGVVRQGDFASEGPATEPTANIAPGVDTSPYAIDAKGENLTVNIGDGANISGSVEGSSGGSAVLSFGENATVGGGVTGATGSNTDQTSSITFGNGANVIGPITSNHGFGETALTMGGDPKVTGAIYLADGVDPTSTATLTLGDDTLVPGTQAVSAGLTQIDGGNLNGSETDLIRIGARPGQQPAFDSAGGISNRDGTHSSPGPAFNASPALRTAAVMEVSA